MYAASIHSLEYRNKHISNGSNTDEEMLHDVIIKSQSFFLSCKFTHMMAQFLTGCEASFVMGCVDPLNLDETIDTL